MNIHPKVTAAALVGVLTAVATFVFSTFGITLNAAEASTLTVVLSTIAGYIAPSPAANTTPGA